MQTDSSSIITGSVETSSSFSCHDCSDPIDTKLSSRCRKMMSKSVKLGQAFYLDDEARSADNKYMQAWTLPCKVDLLTCTHLTGLTGTSLCPIIRGCAVSSFSQAAPPKAPTAVSIARVIGETITTSGRISCCLLKCCFSACACAHILRSCQHWSMQQTSWASNALNKGDVPTTCYRGTASMQSTNAVKIAEVALKLALMLDFVGPWIQYEHEGIRSHGFFDRQNVGELILFARSWCIEGWEELIVFISVTQEFGYWIPDAIQNQSNERLHNPSWDNSLHLHAQPHCGSLGHAVQSEQPVVEWVQDLWLWQTDENKVIGEVWLGGTTSRRRMLSESNVIVGEVIQTCW